MLIRERFETTAFSQSEQTVVDYILEKKTDIEPMTTKQIAAAAFTVPSTLIRIAKKMNYAGWNDLKEDYLKEERYLQSHFTEIDPNYPFQRHDSIMTIAAKIASLRNESVNDTLSLMTHDELQGAIRIMRDASLIGLFAASNNLYISREFKHNMSRIKRRVEIYDTQGEIVFNASLMEQGQCAIIISYSGETAPLIRVAHTLKLKGIPFIAITNIGENTISRLADVTLHITTRERLFSKIATFTTDSAIEYLLDVLYSCVFALNYDDNVNLKATMSKIVEKERFSDTKSINEALSDVEFYKD